MAQITKAELTQQLLASQRDNAALREQLSVLRAELEAAQRAAQAPATKPARPAYQPRHDGQVLDERTGRWMSPHLIAARELAMRTGKTVRVGA